MGNVNWFQAVVLGLVQGLTEFLPISSTAHLLVTRDVLHWGQQKYYMDAIQFGSVIAVLLYFRQDLQKILTGSWAAWQAKDWQRQEWRLFLGIIVGTLPALIGGYLLKDAVPESPLVIAIMSIVMACLLGLAERIGSRKRDMPQLTVLDGLLMGLAQVIAIIPGGSRSGCTITAGLFLGQSRPAAARFSFLIGLPTLAAATLFQARKAFDKVDSILMLGIGMISAFIFSYLAIAWLLKFLQTQNTWIFVWYRLAFGAALLVGVFNGFFNATTLPE
jgi:undecaprenyl-diphosphatase